MQARARHALFRMRIFLRALSLETKTYMGEGPEGGYGNSPHMRTVALSILVMGISLAIVIVLWAWFGWIGPGFSNDVLRHQQQDLRAQYGLEPAPVLNEKDALTPPSLRGK
jgi:hypothetical protein